MSLWVTTDFWHVLTFDHKFILLLITTDFSKKFKQSKQRTYIKSHKSPHSILAWLPVLRLRTPTLKSSDTLRWAALSEPRLCLARRRQEEQHTGWEVHCLLGARWPPKNFGSGNIWSGKQTSQGEAKTRRRCHLEMFPQTLDVMRQMRMFDSVLMFANTIPINCSREVRQTPKPATTTHLADHLRSQKVPGRPEQHPLQWLKQWHWEEFWCDMRMSQNTGKNTKWITQSRFTQHVLKSLKAAFVFVHLAYDDWGTSCSLPSVSCQMLRQKSQELIAQGHKTQQGSWLVMSEDVDATLKMVALPQKRAFGCCVPKPQKTSTRPETLKHEIGHILNTLIDWWKILTTFDIWGSELSPGWAPSINLTKLESSKWQIWISFYMQRNSKNKMNLFSPFRRGSMLSTGIWWNCRRCTSIFRTACRLWADALGQFALNSHWHFGALKRDLSASHETSTGNMRLLWKCLLSLDSEMFMICFLLWSLGFSWHNLWELKLQPFRLRWSHDRCLPSAVRLLGAQRLRKSCVMADKPGQT